MRVAVFVLGVFLLIFPDLASAQFSIGAEQIGGITLTSEQQQILDSLPENQRAEVLRQINEFRARQQQGGGQEAAPTERPDGQGDNRTSSQRDDREAINPSDTLVIEVLFPRPQQQPGQRAAGDNRTAQAVESRTHLLRGKHTVQLDRFGRLSLPGLPNIPLAGLSPEQAELRLMAEPTLADMIVYVTRLPLMRTGRDALEPFGYKVFQRPVERLDRIRLETSLPVPSDYVVGPGDELQIFLFGKDSGRHQLRVTSDGLLEIPTLGPVPVAGMTYSAVRQLVERRIREETIGTQASVSMGELRSIEVFVVGEVLVPGLHQISSMSTVVSALYQAQGITEIGTLRDIRLLRSGGEVERLDLYDLLLAGNPRGDVRLHTGDVVFVPATGPRAGVMGETLRPAWYELSGRTTLGELLSYAGGEAPEGDLGRVQIQRRGDDGLLRYIDVDATTQAGRGEVVRAHDLVTIPRVVMTAENAVALHGHFGRTGLREWREGMRIRDLIPNRNALQPEPDLDYGLVVRHTDDGRGVRVLMFSPRALLADAGSPDNLELEPRDEVYAFGFDKFVERRALVEPLIERLRRQALQDSGAQVVQVTGAVRAPGMYPLAEGMRLSDLTRAGGGLAEAAFGDAAEVTRYDTNGGTQRQIEHIEVNLARVMERDPGSDLLLQAHDVLNIKQIPSWTERGTIELRGEVRFPGSYPIRPGETLANIIERAGGLTDLAFPRAAVFMRETLREREQQQIDNMVRRLEADVAAAAAQGGPTGAQAQALAGSLVQQLKETRAAGRLVIDLPRLMRSPGSIDHDVLVHDGDVLVVPPRPQEVTVLGEVYFPTSHIYDPDLRGNAYLERSGGMTQRADGRRIYVVRANGAVETASGWRGRLSIEPGDTIVVPLDAERLPTMVRVMNISQILYQLAITAAALQTIGAL